MYCPDLDDAVIPINFVTTFVLEINQTKPEGEQLEHMTPSCKVKQIWKLLNEENELKDIFNCDHLWDRPSLR